MTARRKEAYRIARLCPWLEGVPYIPYVDDASYLDKVAEVVAAQYSGEFCWASSFDARFVAALMARGFLTMAQRVGDTYALLPKMHRNRCVLLFRNRRVPRSLKRKAKHFHVAYDADLDAVVKGIANQHGDECWLYPPLVSAFAQLYKKNGPVSVHTFECYKDGHLVAGELGYACGDVYTSLSGFSTVPSAGSVQCAATANWLRVSGYRLWDLGMELPYKLAMGASSIPRIQFLAIVRQAQHKNHLPLIGPPATPINARAIVLADAPFVPDLLPHDDDEAAAATADASE